MKKISYGKRAFGYRLATDFRVSELSFLLATTISLKAAIESPFINCKHSGGVVGLKMKKNNDNKNLDSYKLAKNKKKTCSLMHTSYSLYYQFCHFYICKDVFIVISWKLPRKKRPSLLVPLSQSEKPV